MSSYDLTLDPFAALTLLSLAAPQRPAPRFLTQTPKLDSVQLLRPSLALRPSISLWCSGTCSGTSEARRAEKAWRRSLNLAAPALPSPRSSAAPCTADPDADAEADHPASHVFVVCEPVVSSCYLTLVNLAAVTLLSIAAPPRPAPRLLMQKPTLDSVQLLRLRLALRSPISIWCIRDPPCREGFGDAR